MLPRLSIPTRIQNPTGFAQSRAEDIDEIVDQHLASNAPVERLVMVLTR